MRSTRGFAVLVAATLALALCFPRTALSQYGYAEDVDPFLEQVKDLVRAARGGDWDAVRATTDALEWKFRELEQALEVDLRPSVEAAAADRDLDAIAGAIARLTFLVILQQFHENEREELKNYPNARARLAAARRYYEDVLDGSVRALDEAEETRRSIEILELFDTARKSLGSPGLFGRGKRPPDPAEFSRTTALIRARLEEAFPDFVELPAEAAGAEGGKAE